MGRVARTLSPVSGSGDPQSWTGLGHQILLQPTNRWSPGQTLVYPHTAPARLDDNSRAPSTLGHETLRATCRGWSHCLAILQMRKLSLGKGYLFHDHHGGSQDGALGLALENSLQAKLPGLHMPLAWKIPKAKERKWGAVEAVQRTPAWERGFGGRAPRGAPTPQLPSQSSCP